MFPNWFSNLFFGFLALLIVCGAIMIVIISAVIIKGVIDERRDERRKGKKP